MVMLVAHAALLGCLLHPVQGPDDPLDRKVSVKSYREDVRTVLRRVFGGKTKYTVDPEVQGFITVDIRDQTIEYALQNILRSLEATYRIENGAVIIVPKGELKGCLGPEIEIPMPEFLPGKYTSSVTIRNPKLYLSPDRTMGGSYNVILKSVAKAGFGQAFVYGFGKSGFALVLAPEAIGSNGTSTLVAKRLSVSVSSGKFDFNDHQPFDPTDADKLPDSFRVIALLVNTSSSLASGENGFMLSKDEHGLPSEAIQAKWKDQPKMTVFVYEFRSKNASSRPELVKRTGDSKAAREAIVQAELWNDAEIF